MNLILQLKIDRQQHYQINMFIVYQKTANLVTFSYKLASLRPPESSTVFGNKFQLYSLDLILDKLQTLRPIERSNLSFPF